MKKTSKNRISRRPSRRHRVGSWFVRFLHKIGTHAQMAGALLFFSLAVFLLYQWVIGPVTRRWLGVYGDVKFPSGYSIRGIDVSHHQGKINWEKLSKACVDSVRVSFAFIKATEGTDLIDECFEQNFSAAREAGIVRGAYHYFRPELSASAQARHFADAVFLEPGDLPPVLDLEEKGDLSSEALRDSALVWLRYMERCYGVKPILYTYAKFRTQYLGYKEMDEYPYWIAHYYVDTLSYTGPWKFWQHTDRGRLPGIRGDVDLNCYNGSMYDLKRLAIPDDD